jgi:hypothetical protein
MSEENLLALSFKVSTDEAQIIQAAADEKGISRSEYLRNAISEYIHNRKRTPADAPTSNVERLLRHVIYMASRIHIAVYSMHEMAATLSKDQLKTIYEGTRSASAKYLAELSDELTLTEARIAEQARLVAAKREGANDATKVGEARP